MCRTHSGFALIRTETDLIVQFEPPTSVGEAEGFRALLHTSLLDFAGPLARLFLSPGPSPGAPKVRRGPSSARHHSCYSLMRTPLTDHAAFGRERTFATGRFSANHHPPRYTARLRPGRHCHSDRRPLGSDQWRPNERPRHWRPSPGRADVDPPAARVALVLWRTTVHANVMPPPEAGPAACAPGPGGPVLSDLDRPYLSSAYTISGGYAGAIQGGLLACDGALRQRR